MTLFKLAAVEEALFKEVIEAYYMGYDDRLMRIKLDM